MPRPSRDRWPTNRGRTVVASLLAATLAVGAAIVASTAGATPETARQATTTTPAASGGTADGSTALGSNRIDPGRIAYVTPSGDVVVADSTGANPVVVGGPAATNGRGLAPLAWRLPVADAITFVRRDGALVTVSVEGGEPIVHATDAVVPADVSDQILSWDSTGTWLAYLAQPVPGRIESRVIDFSTAGDGLEPEIRTLGDATNRQVRAQFFSPLDPIIYQDTVDPETGAKFTASVVSPLGGEVIATNFSVDDASFSPDGRYLFAVSKISRTANQMIRVALREPTREDLVFDNERVCSPSMSPDGRLLVFGAGPDCSQVWRLNANGTEPTMLASDVLGATFSVGQFTWSLDGTTVSHPLCQGLDGSVTCDGPYLDISVSDGTVTERAAAGNVVRESKPLTRNLKVGIDITGPIEYSGRMQVGERSVADTLAARAGSAASVKAVDALDTARSFELTLVNQENSDFVAGTVRIIDGGFDQTFPFFARLTPYSLGYARLRGIWTRSEEVPLTSGNIVITLER